MFIVTQRNTFLPETDRDAVLVLKFRHVQQGEPALNVRAHMSKQEADAFKEMIKSNTVESKDIMPGVTLQYSITAD